MAGAYVQGAFNYTGGDSAPALVGVTPGNSLICVSLSNSGTTDPTSVTSTLDGAFTKITAQNAGGGGQLSAYWKAAAGGSNGVGITNTVNVNNGGAAINSALIEVSGLSAVDTFTTIASGFNAAPTSAALTPGAVGVYVLGILTNNNADVLNSMTTPTERLDQQGARGIALGDQTAASLSGITVSGSLPGGPAFWYGLVISFTVSAGGGGGPLLWLPSTQSRRGRRMIAVPSGFVPPTQ